MKTSVDYDNIRLSICVVTMNRSVQLKEALESCLKCDLPPNTEFVLIDNASIDDTETVVRDVLENSEYHYYYEKLPENLGVGAGRNYAFNKSHGEYIYVLDDDAVIDASCPNFFVKALSVFENHSDVVTLTTQIYDLLWKKNRVLVEGKPKYDGVYRCYMFCGGSHFLRKSFFKQEPYLGNKYGYEEIIPSMIVVDSGFENVSVPELLVIHKPVVNKWDYEKKENVDVLMSAYAVPYAIKRMIYPKVFAPVLHACFVLRKCKYIKSRVYKKKANCVYKQIMKDYDNGVRVRSMTVIRQFLRYGIRLF